MGGALYTDDEELHTGAVGTITSINEIIFTNTTANTVLVSLEMWPLGTDNMPSTIIRLDWPFVQKETKRWVGVLILLAADKLMIRADAQNSIDVWGNMIEVT